VADLVDTRTRILDAAVEAASIHGISRLSVGDVASRAGYSRPTLYKHFGSKDALVAAAVQRETETIVSAILAAARGHSTAREALEAGVLTALELLRDHPLLDRILRTEPEALVPLLTVDGSPVLVLARVPVQQIIAERYPDLDEVGARRLADILARLIISYALSAPDDPAEVVAAAIATVIGDGAAALTETPLAPLENR